jgi:hypothetical protein
MRPVSVPILARLYDILKKRTVAPRHPADYKKWVWFFWISAPRADFSTKEFDDFFDGVWLGPSPAQTGQGFWPRGKEEGAAQSEKGLVPLPVIFSERASIFNCLSYCFDYSFDFRIIICIILYILLRENKNAG